MVGFDLFISTIQWAMKRCPPWPIAPLPKKVQFRLCDRPAITWPKLTPANRGWTCTALSPRPTVLLGWADAGPELVGLKEEGLTGAVYVLGYNFLQYRTMMDDEALRQAAAWLRDSISRMEEASRAVLARQSDEVASLRRMADALMVGGVISPMVIQRPEVPAEPLTFLLTLKAYVHRIVERIYMDHVNCILWSGAAISGDGKLRLTARTHWGVAEEVWGYSPLEEHPLTFLPEEYQLYRLHPPLWTPSGILRAIRSVEALLNRPMTGWHHAE